MGGWYSGDDRELWYSDGGGADSAGQWLSAFARMAKANDDQAMRDKALHLMREWARTIAPDGFCGSLEHGGGSHVNHYVFDKLCGGLVDIAHYLQEREALAHLATITRWAMHNLGARSLARRSAQLRRPDADQGRRRMVHPEREPVPCVRTDRATPGIATLRRYGITRPFGVVSLAASTCFPTSTPTATSTRSAAPQ